MGELNLDDIDRALLQEYRRRQDSCGLREAVKASDNHRPGEKIPAATLWDQASSDSHYAGTRQR